MGQALCPCPRGTVSLAGTRYVVLQRLGEGGSSYVELVEGLRDGRAHALKRIVCHDAEASGAALREVEMHRLLAHPHVLRLEAHGLVDKGATREAWLLLPFFQRGTLWSEVEALRDKGAFMGEERIVLVLRGICRGLEAIHTKGYAHRDLKPTNVLLGDDDHPVLMDLGSVNQARIEVRSSREAMAVQDWAAQHCTISYRAPELFTVESQCVIDERTDIWSLGCVLYCMMFGEGPYDMVFQKGDSVALAVQNPVAVPPHARYSPTLEQLLRSMMAVNPQERPYVTHILDQLERLQPALPGQDTTRI